MEVARLSEGLRWHLVQEKKSEYPGAYVDVRSSILNDFVLM